MNKMKRDKAVNIIHPKDRAIFNNTTTVQCNATKYAIARKQPAFDFIAQLSRNRWSSIAIHIAKQVHGIVINNFDIGTLEPLIVTRRNGFHPTRLGRRQQQAGEKQAHATQPRPSEFSAQQSVAHRMISESSP